MHQQFHNNETTEEALIDLRIERRIVFKGIGERRKRPGFRKGKRTSIVEKRFEFHTCPHNVRHTLVQIDGVPWRHCTVRYVYMTIVVEFIKGKIDRWLFFRFGYRLTKVLRPYNIAVVVFWSLNDE